MRVGLSSSSCRIFNISNSKQKKLFKGSQGDDGTLIKVCCCFHGDSTCGPSVCGQVMTASSIIFLLRCRSTPRVSTSPPPAQTRTSAYLTSTQESVWPPCSVTQVSHCVGFMNGTWKYKRGPRRSSSGPVRFMAPPVDLNV